MRDEPGKRPSVTTRLARIVVGALLLVTCLRVWVGPDSGLPAAQAQLANPAAQRLEAVQEMQRTNELLVEIRDILNKGTLHVRLEGADNQSDASTGPRGADR